MNQSLLKYIRKKTSELWISTEEDRQLERKMGPQVWDKKVWHKHKFPFEEGLTNYILDLV